MRSKINTADLKDHRNIVANPSKRGMGGYIAAPGVLMNPFPEHMSEDYDAEHKAALAEAAAHKAAQTATDEKCRYISTVRPGIQLAHPSMCASSGVGVREPSSLDAMNPKQRAEVVNAARPWTQGADRVWRRVLWRQRAFSDLTRNDRAARGWPSSPNGSTTVVLVP